LVISATEIGRHGPGHILAVCWRQWRAERDLARRGIHFRSTDQDQITAAYAAMTPGEFDAINGRQDWANWRTIPRCLSGNVPDIPLRMLDLGCGTGGSTRVLAFHAPAGSHITGYELAEALMAIARGRPYCDRAGQQVRVDFRCQGVTEPWRDIHGDRVADASVDVVNASGVVGHHLDARSIQPLTAELRRILRPEGIAMLDVGPTLGEPQLTRIIEGAGFQKLGHWRSWWLDPTGQVVYQKCGNSPV
jgi:SAM-dependent methyltransferase